MGGGRRGGGWTGRQLRRPWWAREAFGKELEEMPDKGLNKEQFSPGCSEGGKMGGGVCCDALGRGEYCCKSMLGRHLGQIQALPLLN